MMASVDPTTGVVAADETTVAVDAAAGLVAAEEITMAADTKTGVVVGDETAIVADLETGMMAGEETTFVADMETGEGVAETTAVVADMVTGEAVVAERLVASLDEETAKELGIETALPEESEKFRNKLDYVEGIGPVYAAKLAEAGVMNPLDLLNAGATPKGRQDLAEKTGISHALILKWVNHADLYRIKGVGSEYADLLEAAGVDTVVELATRNPQNLFEKMTMVNEEKMLVRKTPVLTQVEGWVEQANMLPRILTY
jgi:predicted flap endonuclease-1-like 5' DNA nuclease